MMTMAASEKKRSLLRSFALLELQVVLAKHHVLANEILHGAVPVL